MPDIDSLIPFVVFIVFIVVAIARKIAEQRDATKHQQEMGRQKPQDLPDATRRMLYGDSVPTAQPRTFDDEEVGRPVVVPQQRAPQVPTAQPRQGQPQRPVPPPVAPRRAQPATVPPARPATPPMRVPAPQQRRTAQGPATIRPQESQRQQTPPMRQPQQVQRTVRRDAPPPLVQATAQQQQSRKPAPKSRPTPVKPERQAARRATAEVGRYFDDREDLRRAIVLREILGPPKAFEGLD